MKDLWTVMDWQDNVRQRMGWDWRVSWLRPNAVKSNLILIVKIWN